jgi:hypothetical protein
LFTPLDLGANGGFADHHEMLRRRRRSGRDDARLSAGARRTLVLETIGDDKIRGSSSSLDHPVVILADQSLEIAEIAKTLYCAKVGRSAYWLNIDPTGMVEAGYGPELK